MAALKDTLKTDLVAAMKARDEQTKTVLRAAIAAIGTAEVAGESARELDEAEERGVVAKEARKRHEAAEAYAAGGRPELAESERAEAAVLERYLPARLSDAELGAIVDARLAAAEAELGEKPGMRQMGSIMKAVNAEVDGRADGSAVAALVKARLA